jgi:hypothetical protein
MENIMPSHNLPDQRHRRRMLGASLGLAIALLANFGDRAFMASSNNNGIDPLQILDTELKNNILFMVGTSETMAGTPESSTNVIGADDPASRFYQVKRALRKIITENTGKANFGVASFHPEAAEHVIGAKDLVYVSQDPSANNYLAELDRSGGSVLAITLGAVNTATDTVANNTTHTTASYTPAANSLLILFVVAQSGTTFSNVTGHGLASGTYTQVGTTSAGGGQSMALFVAKAGSAPNSTGASVDVSNNRPVTMVEYYVTGADLTGTAAQALAQTVTTVSSSNGTTASTTLAAASNAKNAVMYFVVHGGAAGTNQVASPAAGWTEGSDSGTNHTSGSPSNDAGIESQYNLTFSTAASATWATSSAWAAKALEIKVAAAATLIDTCATSTACTAAESSAIFDLFASNDGGTSTKYPSTCTDQSADRVAAGGTVGANTLTHTLGTNCRYYMRSKVLLNGKRYKINRTLAPAAPAITAYSTITCPAPPPGLLGDDTLDAGDGTKNRACFQLEDTVSPFKITTYWLTGTQFKYSQVTAPASTPAAANESGIVPTLGEIGECGGADNSANLQSIMKMELLYDSTTGLPFTPPSPVAAVEGLTSSTTGTNGGLRLGTGSPITNSLTAALTYFRNNVLTAAGTTKRPLAAQGKQKQFVILIVDADDATGATLTQLKTAAYALYSNTTPTLPTCTGSCGALGDLTAAQWAAANRIELIVVPYGAASTDLTQATMDALAAAGSGMNPANTTCDSGGTCRSAPIANNYDELLAALRAAVFAGSGTGTFSDQQSVTETLFEFASLATPSKDPLDPFERYAVAIPVLLQSTFELPDFKGHLNAVRRNNAGTPTNPADDFQEVVWDAGSKLYERVSKYKKDGTTLTALGGMNATLYYPFTDLYGDGTTSNIKTSTALIKRRIYTTTQNGVNANYTVDNLLAADFATTLAGASGGMQRVALWPPSHGTADLTSVAPQATGTTATPIRGQLDTAMGFDAWTTLAQVQAAVPGACDGPGLHAECTSDPLPRAKREAREIILAYLAGARVKTINGVVVRVSGVLQYEVRPWIMVESTLASPGVVTPPLLAAPSVADGDLGAAEYVYYRDGIRTSALAPVNGVLRGLGLRNPDRLDASAASSLQDAATANLDLKPSMSVVYHSTNQGLHAFRAGPCPTPTSGSGISTAAIPCSGEGGGEEMWAYVPYDLLYKLPALTIAQTRTSKQYLLAAPVRFSDVFVPGTGSFSGVSFTGVWRTILYFGRGQGGKYFSALDVTTPGPFTLHSLDTTEPIVVWNRGNPDTTKGILTGAGGVVNNSNADYTAYLKMGETWSVPALGYVDSANFGTNFALFTGSGYSDVATEGKTFYVLDALNGNVLRSFDIADNTSVPAQTPTLTNFLVASPVGYGEDADGNSPAGYRFLGNPITVKTTKVYFGDLHSRLWRYDALTPATAPTLFYSVDIATTGNQPFATPVSVLQNRPDTSVAGDVLVFAETGHDRRVALDTTKKFKAYALKDNGSTGDIVFTQNFPDNYRGTVQPASAFAGTSSPPTPVVFYAGIKFNTNTSTCVPTFDSILMALKGTTPASPTVPDAAFDLKASGDDTFIELSGTKIQAIRVSGEGSLVIDQGLAAQNVPPPPGVPVPTTVIPGSSGLVKMGLTPGTQDYKDLAATTAPYRIGSSVCRTQ